MLSFLTAIGLVAASLGLVVYLITRAEKGGAAMAKTEQQDEVLDAIRDHQEIKADVDARPAAAARDELRTWSRD